MAMGRREAEQQADLFVMHDKLPRSPGHVFYDKLNGLLRESGFDAYVEGLCEPHYAKGKGRPSVPPQELIRSEIAETVCNPTEVDDEIRYLLAVLRSR